MQITKEDYEEQCNLIDSVATLTKERDTSKEESKYYKDLADKNVIALGELRGKIDTACMDANISPAISSYEEMIEALSERGDTLKKALRLACEKVQESPISIGHKELCPMEGYNSRKCNLCRQGNQVKSPTDCWQAHFIEQATGATP